MNSIIIWIFLSYFTITIIVNGIIALNSKKLIKNILTQYPEALEKIVADNTKLNLIKKGYFLQGLNNDRLTKNTNKELADRLKKILPMTYVSYVLMGGLFIFLIVIIILMPVAPVS